MEDPAQGLSPRPPQPKEALQLVKPGPPLLGAAAICKMPAPMRPLLLAAVLLCIPLTAGAQSPKSTTVSGEAEAPMRRHRQPETPESLYNKGLGQMKRGYLDEAIISFEKVRNHFPFNQYSVLAELRVADCLFERQGYLEAVVA